MTTPDPFGDWADEYAAATMPGRAAVQIRPDVAVVQLRGRDRQTFLQGQVSNDVAALTPGQGCRAAQLDSTGHVQADMRVHCLPDALLLETHSAVVSRLAATLDKYLIMEKVAIEDMSGEWAVLRLIGDAARPFLLPLLAYPLPDSLPVLSHVPMALADGATGFVVGLTNGFDVWLPREMAAATREKLTATGARAMGEVAANVLRVEACEAAWGSELDEKVLLPEADIPNIVSYAKGCYVGQEIIARLRARGHANRLLRGILLADTAPIPHPGDTLHVPESALEDAGREIGRITSAVASPKFGGRALALGYVRKEWVENGTVVAVQISQPGGAVFEYAATVLTRPFLPM